MCAQCQPRSRACVVPCLGILLDSFKISVAMRSHLCYYTHLRLCDRILIYLYLSSLSPNLPLNIYTAVDTAPSPSPACTEQCRLHSSLFLSQVLHMPKRPVKVHIWLERLPLIHLLKSVRKYTYDHHLRPNTSDMPFLFYSYLLFLFRIRYLFKLLCGGVRAFDMPTHTLELRWP